MTWPSVLLNLELRVPDHEIKRHLLLGRKVMTNLDSILKSRDITLPTKAHLVKAMVFPMVMYGCERWTIKKAEHLRNDAFNLWCWRRLLRAPWTARRSNQSILKEISPGCSLEGLKMKLNSNTLATSGEELTHWKRPWCWEGLGTGGEGDNRGWDGWMASPTRWAWVWVNSRSWWWTWRPSVLRFMGLQSRTWLSYWTELNWTDQVSGYVTLSILNAIGCALCSDINCFNEARTKGPSPVVSLQAWSISILNYLGEAKPSKKKKKRGLQRTDFKLDVRWWDPGVWTIS